MINLTKCNQHIGNVSPLNFLARFTYLVVFKIRFNWILMFTASGIPRSWKYNSTINQTIGKCVIIWLIRIVHCFHSRCMVSDWEPFVLPLAIFWFDYLTFYEYFISIDTYFFFFEFRATNTKCFWRAGDFFFSFTSGFNDENF